MSSPAMTRRAALAGASAALLAASAARAAAPRGFDPRALARAMDQARALEQLHAVVVARDGDIAAAEAFRGPPLDRPVNVKSVSKSVVAALLGCALERGEVPGLDARFAEIAPGLIPAGADPRVREITLEHLVTMQAGLERTSGANYGPWVQSRNWVAHALTRPFSAPPGTRMQYSTGSFHLLGAALSEASGRSLLTLARERLGAPLNVDIPAWTRDPQGFYMGGNEMALSPLAMLRFGEAHRQGGVWNGARLFAEDWVAAAWTPRTRSPWSGDAYGLGWFLRDAGGVRVAYARGFGGQMIFVAPEAGVTVAITSDPSRPARSEGHAGALQDLFARLVLSTAA